MPASVASADEYFKVVKLTCAPELGFVEGYATGAVNIGRLFYKNPEKRKQELIDKYGLYLRGDIKVECPLSFGIVNISIKYRQASASGRCGANPGAMMYVNVGDKKAIYHMPFHENCYSVSAFSFRVDKYNIKVCGRGHGEEGCLQIFLWNSSGKFIGRKEFEAYFKKKSSS
jgi:hypothetical protein